MQTNTLFTIVCIVSFYTFVQLRVVTIALSAFMLYSTGLLDDYVGNKNAAPHSTSIGTSDGKVYLYKNANQWVIKNGDDNEYN